MSSKMSTGTLMQYKRLVKKQNMLRSNNVVEKLLRDFASLVFAGNKLSVKGKEQQIETQS